MKKKQIGGPGYVGTYVTIHYKGERKSIFEANANNLEAVSIGLKKGSVIRGWVKQDPHVSATLVASYDVV